MSRRERFNRQMHYQPVERCFNMEFGYWNENFQKWPMFRENAITNNREADLFFSFDKIEVVSGNVWMSPPFPETIVDETPTTNIIMNAEGLLAEVPNDGHDTIPHFIRPTVITPHDWEEVKRERFRRDDPHRKVAVSELKRLHPGDRDYPLGVDCGSMIGKIRDMLTFEGLAHACYDYPDLGEDMVETCCLLVEDFLEQVLDSFDFDFAAGWEDICYNSGPIVSVQFFRDAVIHHG